MGNGRSSHSSKYPAGVKDVTKRTLERLKKSGKSANIIVRDDLGNLNNFAIDSIVESVSGINTIINYLGLSNNKLPNIEIGDHIPQYPNYFNTAEGARAMAAAYANYIAFNPNYYNKFSTREELNANYARQVDTHFHPTGTTISSNFVHEYGHALETKLCELSSTDPSVVRNLKADHWFASSIVKEAHNNLKNEFATIGKARLSISRYANDPPSTGGRNGEALAEAVADFAANGANATKMSLEIMKILKREFQNN